MIAHRIDRFMRRAGGDRAPACRPGSAPVARGCEMRSIAATISEGSAIRPGPYSPHAISPLIRPDTSTPSPLSGARLRWRRRMVPHAHVHRRRDQHLLVGGKERRRGKIIGKAVAILAMRSALAGATTSRSAARDNSICPISTSSVRLKRSVWTFSPVRLATDSGVTNCSAALVMMARTRDLALRQAGGSSSRLL